MDWDDAKYLLAVARAGQMLGAARRLGVNQATLGRRITSLEESLGVRLVDRKTTGTTLTDEGRALLPRLERIEAEFLAAQSEMTGEGAEVSGTVRLGAPDGFGVGFLAPRLAEFQDRYPAVQLQLVPVPRVFSLSQREADLAVMVGRPERGRLKARKLTEYTLGLYASKAYLDRYGMPEDVEALADHRLVGYVDDLIPTPQFNYAREIFGARRPDLEISSATGQFEAVRAGAGIGILHDFMMRDGDPIHILPEISISRSYWIAWHPTVDGTPRARALIDFLVDIVARARGLLVRAAGDGA